MKRQTTKKQKTKIEKKSNLQIFDIFIQRVAHISFIMNNDITWYQEHLPKFDIMFNRGIYFMEKSEFLF